jgi:uncharacterized membrane protein YidH (DUF202 family)
VKKAVKEVTEPDKISELDNFILNEVQLLLSEKRTSLSTLRTGIAIFALPLSVLSILIATSRLWDVLHVIHLLVALVILNAGLVALATWLVVAAIRRLLRYDRHILALKSKHSKLAQLLD